jgi:hypothetical protein
VQSLEADCISGFGFRMGEGGRVRRERDLEKRGERKGGKGGEERERRKGGGERRGGERERTEVVADCV